MAVGTLMQALLVVVCIRSRTVAATENTLTRQTLIQAYDAMGGTTWRTSTGWRSTISYCNWTGVVCDSAGNVSGLDLPENSLRGTIPEAWGISVRSPC